MYLKENANLPNDPSLTPFLVNYTIIQLIFPYVEAQLNQHTTFSVVHKCVSYVPRMKLIIHNNMLTLTCPAI